MLWKELNLSSVLFGEAFCLEPECGRVILLLHSIVQEQFSEYEFTELGLSAHPFERLNWTFT